MKSPIKDQATAMLCLATLKTKFPVGSVIDVYRFYSGQVEFNLAATNRFIKANTISYPVYEFWQCMAEDAKRVYEIATSESFQFQAEMFPLLQEGWYNYRDPYIRAALFFILNRCSSTGFVSSGQLSTEYFNPISLSYLRSFAFPQHFHLTHVPQNTLSGMIDEDSDGEYLFVPCGSFSYNLFEHGKSRGREETPVNHQELRHRLRETSKKWVIAYKYHAAIQEFYNQELITLVDKYGRTTTDEHAAAEVVISNF